MQEIIEKIGKVAMLYYNGNISQATFEHDLTNILTGTIHTSQFVNGEPEEDGEYVVIFQDDEGEKMYMCIEYTTTDTYRFPILSHCKLP